MATGILVLLAAMWVLRGMGALWRRSIWDGAARELRAAEAALGGRLRARGPGYRLQVGTLTVDWRGGLRGPVTRVRVVDGGRIGRGRWPGLLDAKTLMDLVPTLQARPPWWARPLSPAATTGTVVAVVLATAGVLASMGRSLWCRCASPAPWSWDIWSSHNSQHLVDPYSFTHVLHGVVFFGVLALLFRGRRLDLRWILAVVLESAWEVAENTERVIQHYRETTISLDYYGDSVLNSVADVGACALGFFLASRIPWWASVALFVTVEVTLALVIHDSLVLNVIMLVWPLEAVKQWQMGGAPA